MDYSRRPEGTSYPSEKFPAIKSMLEPVQPLGIKPRATATQTQAPPPPVPSLVPAQDPPATEQDSQTAAKYKPRRKPLRRVPVNHNHVEDESEVSHQELTPIPTAEPEFRDAPAPAPAPAVVAPNPFSAPAAPAPLSFHDAPTQAPPPPAPLAPSQQPPIATNTTTNSTILERSPNHTPSNHQQSTSKGSLTSTSISSSPAKSNASLYTVPSNSTNKFIVNTRTPSPGHASFGMDTAAHVKSLSGSSFDFNGDKAPRRHHSPIVPSSVSSLSVGAGYYAPPSQDQLNGVYPSNYHMPPNQQQNFNNNNGNNPLTRASTAPAQHSPKQQQQQAQCYPPLQQPQPQHVQNLHNRNSSVHSASSSKSQPLHKSPLLQGVKLVPTSSSASASTSMTAAGPNTGHKYAMQKRMSMASSMTNASSTGGGGGSASHKRLDSVSSRTSGASASASEYQHSNVSGSFYVHELRRRAATTWCDIPASVWGVPIGIADPGRLRSAALTRTMAAKKTMDIRHSHLTPRLLASEADDSDYDEPEPTASETAAGTNISRSGSTTKLLASSTNLGVPELATSKSTATLSSPKSFENDATMDAQPQPQSSTPPYETKSGTRSRSSSYESVKSVEEGRKIRLFIANPDSDSD